MLLHLSRFKHFFKIYLLPAILLVVLLAIPAIASAQSFWGTQTTVWGYIDQRSSVKNIWKVALSIVDILVVGGLLVAAFANIFRIKIDNYGLKKILPGLIMGIILANLSYFIMHLLIEVASLTTQGIGILVSSYIGGSGGDTIGQQFAAPYLMGTLWKEIVLSVAAVPTQWQGSLTITGLIQGSLYAFSVGLTSAAAGLGALLLIILILVPILFFLILMFLLYVRNYVLVICFMTAPLAFFALGFDPLKKYWTMWWSNFWKWLAMAPIVFLVKAFCILFMHFSNVTLSAPVGSIPTKDIVDYLFINGVGIACAYAALRLPFSWGTFFGYKVMDNWAKAGLKGTRGAFDGSMKSGAYIYKGSGAYSKAFKSATGAGKSIEEAARAGRIAGIESGTKAAAKAATWNPVRLTQGAFAGYKARQELLEKTEQKTLRKTGTWLVGAGPEAQYRQYQDDNSHIKDIDDAKAVWDMFYDQIYNDKTGKFRISSDKPEDWVKLFIGQTPAKVSSNPLLEGMSQEQRQIAQAALTKFGNLRGRTGVRAGVWGSTGRAMTSIVPDGSGYKFVPYGADDDDDATSGAPIVGGVASSASPTVSGLGGLAVAHQQAHNDVLQIGAAQSFPTDSMHISLRQVQQLVDSGHGADPLSPADFGFASSNPAVMAALEKYKGHYSQLRQGLATQLPEDLQIAAKLGVDLIPETSLDTAALQRDLKDKQAIVNRALRDLGTDTIGTQRETLRRVSGEISKVYRKAIIPDLDDPSARGSLKQTLSHQAQGLSLLTEETMQSAMGQGLRGDDLKGPMQQTLAVRHMKDQTTAQAASVVDALRSSLGTQSLDVATLMSQKESLQPVISQVQAVVQAHPELSQSLLQQSGTTAVPLFEQIAAQFVSHMANETPSGGSATEVAAELSQQEAYSHKLYEIAHTTLGEAPQAPSSGEPTAPPVPESPAESPDPPQPEVGTPDPSVGAS